MLRNIPVLSQLNTILQGAPNEVLTALLLVLAAATVIVAFHGNAVLKAAVAAWIIFP